LAITCSKPNNRKHIANYMLSFASMTFMVVCVGREIKKTCNGTTPIHCVIYAQCL